MSDSSGRFQARGVVFDLFHTLVNPDAHRPDGFIRAFKMAEVLGLSDVDGFSEWWTKMEAQRHVSRSKKVVEYVDEYLLEHTGRRCTAEQLAEVSLIWGQMHDRALLEPEEEVVYALRGLRARGLKLGLLSNIDEREALGWPRSPLSSLFDAVCLSCDIGYSKPSKQAYSSVLTGLGIDASSSVYVGDGSHDELAGAKESGFGLVIFMKGYISRSGIRSVQVMNKRERVADATIMSLSEIANMLTVPLPRDQRQHPEVSRQSD